MNHRADRVIILKRKYGQLTQLVECYRHMVEVEGSSPPLPTSKGPLFICKAGGPFLCLYKPKYMINLSTKGIYGIIYKAPVMLQLHMKY